MKAKKLKITMPHSFVEGLIQMVDQYLAVGYVDDIDKMIMAGLAEIRHRLYMKVERHQAEYTITLTPVQALAVRLFYTEFINNPTDYMGSKLMLIANQVDKTYQQ